MHERGSDPGSSARPGRAMGLALGTTPAWLVEHLTGSPDALIGEVRPRLFAGRHAELIEGLVAWKKEVQPLDRWHLHSNDDTLAERARASAFAIADAVLALAHAGASAASSGGGDERRDELRRWLVASARGFHAAWLESPLAEPSIPSAIPDTGVALGAALGGLECAWGPRCLGLWMLRSVLERLDPAPAQSMRTSTPVRVRFPYVAGGHESVLTFSAGLLPSIDSVEDAQRDSSEPPAPFLVPDPLSFGTSVLEERHLESLRRAFAATSEHFAAGTVLRCGISPLRWLGVLEGRSAGGAYRLAFASLARREREGSEKHGHRLGRVACTAVLDENGDTLKPVGSSFLAKCRALRASGIATLVACAKEPDLATARSEHGDTIRFEAATSVDQVLPVLAGDVDALIELFERLPRAGIRASPFIPPERGERALIPARVLSERRFLELDKERESSGGRAADAAPWSTAERFHELRDATHAETLQDALEAVRGGGIVLRGEPAEGKTMALWQEISRRCARLRAALAAGGLRPEDAELRVPLVLPLGVLAELRRTMPERTLARLALEATLRIAWHGEATWIAGEAGAGASRTGAVVSRPSDRIPGGEEESDYEQREANARTRRELARRWLERKVRRGEYELFIDALDELRGGDELRDWLAARLRGDGGDTPGSVADRVVLLTTRRSARDDELLVGRTRYYVAPWGPTETEAAVRAFFGDGSDVSSTSDAHGNEEKADRRDSPGIVLHHLRQRSQPRALARIPIIVAILCREVWDWPSRPLPATRAEVLRRGLEQFFARGRERREQKSELPETPPPQASLTKSLALLDDVDKRERALRFAAWRYHGCRGERDKDARGLLRAFEDSGLGPADAKKLLVELAGDQSVPGDGVLVPSGTESWRFVLTSFHEYLVASYLAKDYAPLRKPTGEERIALLRAPWEEWPETPWARLPASARFRPGERPLAVREQENVWLILGGLLKGRLAKRALLDALWEEFEELSKRIDAEQEDERKRPGVGDRARGDGDREVETELARRLLLVARLEPELREAIGTSQLLPAIIAALVGMGSKNESQRGPCFRAIAASGSEAAERTLAGLFRNREARVGIRFGAAEAFGEARSFVSRKALVAVLRDTEDDEDLRAVSADALGARIDEPDVARELWVLAEALPSDEARWTYNLREHALAAVSRSSAERPMLERLRAGADASLGRTLDSLSRASAPRALAGSEPPAGLAGYRRIGDREYEHLESGLVFVWILGGTTWIGSPEDEHARDSNEHRHRVELSPYLIAKHAVSQAVWERGLAVARERAQQPRLALPDDTRPWSEWTNLTGDGLPVVGVDWEDARRFCALFGWVLPSEAAWECACRAGTETPFSYGETITTQQVNFDGNYPYREGEPKDEYRRRTVPVGSLPANAWGLCEMHGNVWEWCHDVYDSAYYWSDDARGPDPLSLSGSGYRVLRGGCWYGNAWFCRSAFRFWSEPSWRNRDVGFRPALRLL